MDGNYGFQWAVETLKSIFHQPLDIYVSHSHTFDLYHIHLEFHDREIYLIFHNEVELWGIIHNFEKLQSVFRSQQAGGI